VKIKLGLEVMTSIKRQTEGQTDYRRLHFLQLRNSVITVSEIAPVQACNRNITKRRRQLSVVLQQLCVHLTLSNPSTLPVYANSVNYTAPN